MSAELFSRMHKVINDLHVSQLVDDLSYIAYKNNRVAKPNVKPESWAKVFGEAEVKRYEKRFLAWWVGEHPEQSEGPSPKG